MSNDLSTGDLVAVGGLDESTTINRPTARKWTKDEQAAHRAELVAALRSGKYNQAKSRLVEVSPGGDVQGHCCLGVGCDLAADAGVIPPRDGLAYAGTTALLPDSVQEWLGFTSDTGNLKEIVKEVVDDWGSPATATSLAELNDNGWTFAQIADLIEADGVELES